MSDIETALLTIKRPITPVKHPMHQQESIIPSHILLMNTSNNNNKNTNYKNYNNKEKKHFTNMQHLMD